MSAMGAIVLNGFREARRNRVTTVVGAFAIVLIFATSLVTESTVTTFNRVATDFGLGTMAMILVMLAIYLSCGQIPQEIERKTIFLVVTRPVSRSSFLIARWLGNCLTLFVLLVAMAAVFGLQIWLQNMPFTQPMFASLIGLMAELAVISAVGMLFSTFSSQLVSGVITIGLVIAGHLSGDIHRLAQRSESEGVKLMGTLVYYLVPNLDAVNFRAQATYGVSVATTDLLTGLALSVGYVIVFNWFATQIFERRDFK